MVTMTKAKFDEVAFIMNYEAGTLDNEQQFIEGFQHLLDSGMVWRLQGHYGRVAQQLLDAGLIHRRAN